MASKKHERSRARQGALALLYSSDITEKQTSDIVDGGLYPAEEIVVSDYAEALVDGVAEHCAEIDERLASTSENWAVDRMPVVDRAILRLAVFEMLYVDEVPISVSINEAVELAKSYGGEDESSRFVNGVLGRIARSLEADASGGDDATSGSETQGGAEAEPISDKDTVGEIPVEGGEAAGPEPEVAESEDSVEASVDADAAPEPVIEAGAAAEPCTSEGAQ